MNTTLTDHTGKNSSTRRMAWYFMWFFFVINIMVFIAVLFSGKATLDLNTILFILTWDFIILLAIFYPKYLTKIEEIKALINITKKEV